MSTYGTSSSPTYSYSFNSLYEMLDHLPDNVSQEVSASDVRNSVYTLWTRMDRIVLGSHSVPLGGSAGQILSKNSDEDLDFTWVDGYITYTNPNPTSTTIGGIPSGSTFSKVSNESMWSALLYPVSFASFQITSCSQILEVGDSIPANPVFTWSMQNGYQLISNLTITDVTNSYTLSSSINKSLTTYTSTYATMSNVTSTSNTFRISGNTSLTTLTKDYIVTWNWRKYYGTSANPTASQSIIQSLSTSSISSSGVSGTYNFSANDYKYFCFPYSSVAPSNFTYNGFQVEMADVSTDSFFNNSSNSIYFGIVSVVNSFSVVSSYRVYRTKYTLAGSVTIVVT